MANTIRGDALLKADRALAALVEDPEQLARARGRFSASPPYPSHLSHNSTRSQSPDPPSEEQQHREERKWQLIQEHRASNPPNQFRAQRHEEYRKLFKPAPDSGCMGDDRLLELAHETVKSQWIEQGIWNKTWENIGNMGRWKHEEPLEQESESEAEVKPLFRHPFARARAKPGRPKSIEESRRIAERQAVRLREREASRPFHQFIYQLSKERDRIQDDMNPPSAPDMSDLNRTIHGPVHHQPGSQTSAEGKSSTQGATISTPLDINTTAYERVRTTWTERGIWNTKWGILPGMWWKHEQPLEDMLLEEMGAEDAAPVRTSRPEGDRHGTGEASTRSIFESSVPIESNHEASVALDPSQHEPLAASIPHARGSDDDNGSPGTPPRRNIFRPPSPVESSHGRGSGDLKTSLQESHPPIVKLLNGDPNHYSAASSSRRRHAEGRETPRSVPPQRLRRGKKKPSIESGQASQIARSALSRAHASKVSKTRQKRSTLSRRPNASKSPSETQECLPGLNVPTALPKETNPPRRSKRIEGAKGKAAANPLGIAAAGGGSSHPRRTRVSAGLAGTAKPQGVCKRRSSRIRPK